ncbi:unnamed protein product [Rotaria sordida]|uniref:Uncharacterized protein n=1 Tax=Rotaria sordida TaxID=392033 RepID=A0A815C5Y5_9BILA|nr:unnamed protein product [Rotaria sordida]CAF1279490.1 unnamed protein product [Rotaria sordida]CAF4059261.1 unnamed protein product [Rotaria sordida]
MSKRRLGNKENEECLSSFGKRLQSLSDTFYSTIFEDRKDKKIEIKNAKQLEDLQTSEYEDFTFDQYSTSQITSNDDFSFTFHSINKTKTEKSQIYQTKEINRSSTPYSIVKENYIKKGQDETIIVEENNQNQPIIIGYYPVISYQPICFPPTIYLSNQQIQTELNNSSTLNKLTSIKKN